MSVKVVFVPNVQTLISQVTAATDQYLKIPSVVGHEKPLLNYLRDEYQALGYNVLHITALSIPLIFLGWGCHFELHIYR